MGKTASEPLLVNIIIMVKGNVPEVGKTASEPCSVLSTSDTIPATWWGHGPLEVREKTEYHNNHSA